MWLTRFSFPLSEHLCHSHGEHGPIHAESLQQQDLVITVFVWPYRKTQRLKGIITESVNPPCSGHCAMVHSDGWEAGVWYFSDQPTSLCC